MRKLLVKKKNIVSKKERITSKKVEVISRIELWNILVGSRLLYYFQYHDLIVCWYATFSVSCIVLLTFLLFVVWTGNKNIGNFATQFLFYFSGHLNLLKLSYKSEWPRSSTRILVVFFMFTIIIQICFSFGLVRFLDVFPAQQSDKQWSCPITQCYHSKHALYATDMCVCVCAS